MGETEGVSPAPLLRYKARAFSAPALVYAAIFFLENAVFFMAFFGAGSGFVVVGFLISAFFAAGFFLGWQGTKTLSASERKSKSPSLRMPVCPVREQALRERLGFLLRAPEAEPLRKGWFPSRGAKRKKMRWLSQLLMKLGVTNTNRPRKIRTKTESG